MFENNHGVEKAQRNLTNFGDVVELLNYQKGLNTPYYSLCKVLMREPDSTENETWVYMLFVQGDQYPVVISKKYARYILQHPEEGARLAYTSRMNRYR